MSNTTTTRKPVSGDVLMSEATLLGSALMFLISLALTFTTVVPDYPLALTIVTGALTVITGWMRFFMKD